MASGNSREKLGRTGRSSPAPDGGTGLNHYASLIGTTQGRPAHDQWAKVALIWDTISHYSPVLIAPLANFIAPARPEKNKRFGGEVNLRNGANLTETDLRHHPLK